MLVKRKFCFLVHLTLFIIASSVFASNPPVHHALTITLDPSQSIGRFHDVITIPRSILQSIPGFRLNKNSKIERVELDGKKVPTENSDDRFLKFTLPQYSKEGLADPLKVVCDYTLPLPISNGNMETLFISGADYFYLQPIICL